MAHGVIHFWTVEQDDIVVVMPDVIQVPYKNSTMQSVVWCSQLYAWSLHLYPNLVHC